MLLVLYVSSLLLLVSLRCSAFLAGNFKNKPADHILELSNAKKSVFGDNIVNCRSFELKAPKEFDFVGSYKNFNNIPKFSVPEIAFIGRSNVGKSSLLNCLTGSHKSIAAVGRTPGTTQSVNIFQCNDKSGSICTFADLPGFGFAKLSRSQQDEISQLLKDYFSARGSLKLVMLLVDPRRDPSPADLDTFGVSNESITKFWNSSLLNRTVFQSVISPSYTTLVFGESRCPGDSGGNEGGQAVQRGAAHRDKQDQA